MNIVESIQKAREGGLSDEKILEEIARQNPQKKEAFEKAKREGFSSAQILNEMIEQNSKEEKEESPPRRRTVEMEAPVQDEDGTRPRPQEEKVVPGNIPPRPTEESKLWVRIFITLGLVTLTSFALTILYRTFFIPTLEPISPQVIEKEVRIPKAEPPLLELYPEKDDVQRFAISIKEEYLMNLRRILREERGGEIIRLIIEDQREEVRESRVATLYDFFSAFNIEYPEEFFEKISENFTLLVYTKETPSALGFITSFDKDDREGVEWTVMRPWEETMEEDFLGFFEFWGEDIEVTEEDFNSEDYYGDRSRSDSIRYREGEENIGIYYSLMDDSLIFATSKEAIKEIIDRYHKFKEF